MAGTAGGSPDASSQGEHSSPGSQGDTMTGDESDATVFDERLFSDVSQGAQPEVAAIARRKLLIDAYSHKPQAEWPDNLRPVQSIRRLGDLSTERRALAIVDAYYAAQLKE